MKQSGQHLGTSVNADSYSMPPNNHSANAEHMQSNQVSYTKKWGSVKL